VKNGVCIKQLINNLPRFNNSAIQLREYPNYLKPIPLKSFVRFCGVQSPTI